MGLFVDVRSWKWGDECVGYYAKNYHLTIHFWGLSAKCWNVEAWGGFLWPNLRWNRGFVIFSSFLRLFLRVISDEKSNWGKSLSDFGKNFGGIAILFLSINRNNMWDITNEIRTIIAWIQWICKVFSLQKTANREWTDYGACKRQKGNVRWEISSFFSSNQIW